MNKLVVLIIVLTLFMLVLSGCGIEDKSIKKTKTESKLVTNDPVTIITVSMFGGTDANTGTYQSIIDELTSEYDYITVEDDSQPSNQDWKTKIAADFAVGNEPDVIQFFTDANASDVLATDKFVTIEEIREEYPEYAKDTLEAALAAAANPDGIQRAVPTTGYWEGLFCNKDLFEQYDVELPTNWGNLLKAIETFNAKGIIPVAVSLNEVPHYWIEFLLLSYTGTDGYSTVPKTAPIEWIRAIQMIKTLKDMGAFPEDTDVIDNAYAGNLFHEKKAAMLLDGSWFLSSIPDQDKTVVLAFPTVDGEKGLEGALVGGISSGFYITKKAWKDDDKRDAAVKFVIAHTKKESVQRYWNGNGQAACSVDMVDGMTPLAISGLNYSNAATSILTPTDSRISREAYSILVSGIVDVAAGDKTAKELIDEVLRVNEQ